MVAPDGIGSSGGGRVLRPHRTTGRLPAANSANRARAHGARQAVFSLLPVCAPREHASSFPPHGGSCARVSENATALRCWRFCMVLSRSTDPGSGNAAPRPWRICTGGIA